jgi:hypothetical protein
MFIVAFAFIFVFMGFAALWYEVSQIWFPLLVMGIIAYYAIRYIPDWNETRHKK